MKKINVLFCIPYLAHGGTEKQLVTLINGINRDFFTPHLCCINKDSIDSSFLADALALFNDIDCQTIQLNFKSFKKPSVILQIINLATYINKNKIDIIVSFFIDPPILSFLATKLSLRKSIQVISFRDLGLLRNSHHFLLRYIFRQTPYFIANSVAVKNDYVQNDNIPAKKISVIYNGLDVEQFLAIERHSKSPTSVGIIANLNRRVKRVDIFLEAAALVSKKRPDVSFVVIGEGDLKDGLIALAADLDIRLKVNFVGRSYNIKESLKAIDIGVNTSETEGFTNAILECLASGVPVVATDSGGNKELIKDGENGFLFNVNDAHQLAEKLLLILGNTELYPKLAKGSRESVNGRFSTAAMIQDYENFFKNINNN